MSPFPFFANAVRKENLSMDQKHPRIVIVGGVAAGMKTASRLRRLDPQARIVVIDRGEKLSYGACSLPYFIEGLFADLDEVRQHPCGVLRDETFFRKVKGVEVRSRGEAPRHRPRRRSGPGVRDWTSGGEEELPYDALVLATGNRPILPPVPGIALARGPSAQEYGGRRGHCMPPLPRGARAVIVGGGLIGLEMAEALVGGGLR